MELETKEKALEDLKTMLGNDFKAVEKILAVRAEIVKETGYISDIGYTEYDLDKASCRIYARLLIEFLIEKTELSKVRDDREEDGSISYSFKLESTSRMLAVVSMIVWKDKR